MAGPEPPYRWTRRALMGRVGAAVATALLPRPLLGAAAAVAAPLTKTIPRTAEKVPVIGMGTWLTFDVPDYPMHLEPRVEILRRLLRGGGGVVDSSPMYGRAEATVGSCLKRLGGDQRGLLATTKVWTPMGWAGKQQLVDSRRLWGRERFWLLQIHNMMSWETHFETLRAEQTAGRTRYVGITTSHGRRHDEMEAVLRRERFDFVQLTYNLRDRSVEQRLLPLARERGIGVIANRPLDGGALVDDLAGTPLPGWAKEIGAANWAQVLLKWVVSHPAITCAIPATSQPAHLAENLGAGRGPLPDAAMRQRIAGWFASR
jgi:diketogulonate reductase-like aldo/keto reductase